MLLRGTDLDVFGLCLGGNPFGWTLGAPESEEILDAYVQAGGNFIDTADVYAQWVDGNDGGESETIIGDWMAARGNRDNVVLSTKVGMLPGLDSLDRGTITKAVDASLRRLRTDRIDVYWAHEDDLATPMEETLSAFADLIDAGKVRYIGASNFTADRLAEALAVSDREGLPRYTAMQPLYNLLERDYEVDLEPLREQAGMACIPYEALASGFLTGKYRRGADGPSTARAEDTAGYLNDRGFALLEVLDEIAARHQAALATVAVAWLCAQPGVDTPIAGARSREQLAPLLAATELLLDEEDLKRLAAAGGTSVSAGR